MSPGAAVAVLTLLGLAAPPAPAQAVISTQAGLINYTEGTVFLNNRSFGTTAGKFQQMESKDILRTSGAGRAELLLTPGVFLRVGRASEVQLGSNRIDDARVRLIAGTVLVEAAQIPKGSRVTFACRDATVSIEKSGIYRLQADPALLRVRSGRAVAQVGGKRVEVKGGKMAPLDGSGAVTKFDRKEQDTLDVWSRQRSARLAAASLAALRASRNAKGLPSSGYWVYHPETGTYTFVPSGSMAVGPYGDYYYRDPSGVPFADNSRNPLPSSGVTTPSAVGVSSGSSAGGGGGSPP